MPALNFQKRFAPRVRRGDKRQTIRRSRKRPWRLGDRVYLYTGMRTPACKRLGCGVVTLLLDVRIERNKFSWRFANQKAAGLNFRLSVTGRRDIARADGFRDYAELAEWFHRRYGLPFTGILIRWART